MLLLASAGRLFAGVVMAETSFAKSPNGQISSQDKTVYVQGNKQRIELGNVAEITDLDKKVVYIINRHDRAYAEMPLQAPSSSQPDGMQHEVILKKTGEVRLIANHPCSEYRTVEGNELELVTISTCVSTTAPGAKELSEFARNIITRFSGHKFERPAEKGQAGLMLEKQSVLSFRVPDSSRDRTYHTASYLVETRVNKITQQPLLPETFNPPDGYRKLQNLPPRTAPPDLTILMSSI
ncbi:MAG: hypothetical protein JO189_22900 [Deltaproteobacteria bacterium]|nr:hypothetical protein [Deltaproteobacteria bacterium]